MFMTGRTRQVLDECDIIVGYRAYTDIVRVYFPDKGYMESAMSGMVAGLSLAARLKGKHFVKLPETTIMGALTAYVSAQNDSFQPMNANFGVLPPLEKRIRDKVARKNAYAERAVTDMKEYAAIYERALKE